MTLIMFLVGAVKMFSLASQRNNSLGETAAEWVKMVGKLLSSCSLSEQRGYGKSKSQGFVLDPALFSIFINTLDIQTVCLSDPQEIQKKCQTHWVTGLEFKKLPQHREKMSENSKRNSMRALQTFIVHQVCADTKHGRGSTVATPQKSPRHYSSLQTP